MEIESDVEEDPFSPLVPSALHAEMFSGWQWRLGWLGEINPDDAHRLFHPDAALHSLHGVLAMGMRRWEEWARGPADLQAHGLFPRGHVAMGRMRNTIVWGAHHIVERFENVDETILNIRRDVYDTAPAGRLTSDIYISVLQTTIAFHPGNIFDPAVGRFLPIAVITVIPSSRCSMEVLQSSAEAWVHDAGEQIGATLRPTTRLIFGKLGGARDILAGYVARALQTHCCMAVSGPRDREDHNFEGNGVWLLGPHGLTTGPANTLHRPHNNTRGSGPTLGFPLRGSLFRLAPDSDIDRSSVPILHIGRGSRAKAGNAARQAARRSREKAGAAGGVPIGGRR